MVASWAAVKVGGVHPAAEAVEDEADPDDPEADDEPKVDDEPDDDEDADDPAVPEADEPSFVTVIVY
jgi:hypothetical protein